MDKDYLLGRNHHKSRPCLQNKLAHNSHQLYFFFKNRHKFGNRHYFNKIEINQNWFSQGPVPVKSS